MDYFWKEEVAHFVQYCPEIMADNCENDHWILISGDLDLGWRVWGCRLRSGSGEALLLPFLEGISPWNRRKTAGTRGAGRLGVASS